MSEAPKTIETPVVAAPVETPAAVAEPVVEAPAVTEPATETPATEAGAESTEPVVEAAVEEDKAEEVKPVEAGILGYKGPGLLKSLIFQKKYFWFGTEPVEHKALSSYLRGEKLQDIANKNAAWAAHTGKGLLFFSKKESEKATPHGIFNLSEASEVSEEGTVAFHFTLGGHKHIFETSTLADRDNWVKVLKEKIVEAKELAPTVVESEEYKKAHSELVPVVATATAPKKSVEKEAEEKKDEKAEEKKEKAEEKKARKSRSASRKRNSIFGGFGIGKKEEKVEAAKEETPVVAAPAVEEPVAAAEPATAPETSEAAPAEAAAPAIEKPAPSKRNSIFGTLQSRFSSKVEKKSEDTPVVPTKDAEPVSENAPVIPAVEATEPITSVETPAAPDEVAEAPVSNGEKVDSTPVVKSEKRKPSIPFFTKKEKTTSDDETNEKSAGVFSKLRQTVKGRKEKSAEKVEPTSEAPAAEGTPVAAEPVVSEPANVVTAATPVVAASA